MQNQDSSLLNLAKEIQNLTTEIVDYLSKHQHPEPNFTPTSPRLPETYQYNTLRDSLNDAAQDLLHLINGPKSDARIFFCSIHDLAAWQMALEFKFFSAIPKDGIADLKGIAEKVGMDEDRVGRVIRILATQRVFKEVERGVFGHTASSVLFIDDEQIRDACHYQLDEFFKAASEMSTSVKASPFESSSSNCAFKTRHGVELWDFYKRNPQLAGRFASAMAGVGKLERHFENLRDGYPWETVTSGKVVDMGGGSGHMAIALARAFPNLQILVQDASLEMLSAASHLPISDLSNRVTFMQHSFFDPQPIDSAPAYILRQCTHNWSDDACIRIFKALVPALEKSKRGTPLLINDIVLPEPQSQAESQRQHRLRQVDIMMMGVLGSKQRTETEFWALLTAADPRFKIQKIHSEGDADLMEVHLDMDS
ncbi:S-adenosyl-L-methionine-dependent methyltransferase [Zopfia rhizophila CBS 207.26]|uniref:S-adenosyl-L-methionine-dependent methyltransferase n=1 Tax=Zopfia rhizophila CBS 207.26 TaxID=1314779 RepID=A0A6A6EP21_9PEZI|nr:S-adenosyl-L-methionine-dependent methyltransferase [Zopfia rhizophila CBS 207.26]